MYSDVHEGEEETDEALLHPAERQNQRDFGCFLCEAQTARAHKKGERETQQSLQLNSEGYRANTVNKGKWQMNRKSITIIFRMIGVMLLFSMIGCATVPNPPNPDDPYESTNRKIHTFNTALDKGIIRPIAKGYDVIMPDPLQKGVFNFFSNLGEIPNTANDLLQADVAWALSDTWRFILNTTLGIAGLFDVATPLGLAKHPQDFGLTLAKWGAKKSIYIVIPFLGPSTVRDTVGIPANLAMSVTTYVKPLAVSLALKGTNVISNRANLLQADKVVDEAFDPYVLVRDAYLQNRESRINRNIRKNEQLEE